MAIDEPLPFLTPRRAQPDARLARLYPATYKEGSLAPFSQSGEEQLKGIGDTVVRPGGRDRGTPQLPIRHRGKDGIWEYEVNNGMIKARKIGSDDWITMSADQLDPGDNTRLGRAAKAIVKELMTPAHIPSYMEDVQIDARGREVARQLGMDYSALKAIHVPPPPTSRRGSLFESREQQTEPEMLVEDDPTVTQRLIRESATPIVTPSAIDDRPYATSATRGSIFTQPEVDDQMKRAFTLEDTVIKGDKPTSSFTPEKEARVAAAKAQGAVDHARSGAAVAAKSAATPFTFPKGSVDKSKTPGAQRIMEPFEAGDTSWRDSIPDALKDAVIALTKAVSGDGSERDTAGSVTSADTGQSPLRKYRSPIYD